MFRMRSRNQRAASPEDAESRFEDSESRFYDSDTHLPKPARCAHRLLEQADLTISADKDSDMSEARAPPGYVTRRKAPSLGFMTRIKTPSLGFMTRMPG